jgi:hypothetical protein
MVKKALLIVLLLFISAALASSVFATESACPEKENVAKSSDQIKRAMILVREKRNPTLR